MQADSVNNQRGTMLASATQTLQVERSLDNSAGVISASGALSISGNALALSNTGGQIDSNATLSNDGLMQAATLLKLKARTIMNGAAGTLLGNRLQLNATDAHTVPWLDEGINRVNLVKDASVDIIDWSRDAWGVELTIEQAKIYSLYDDGCFEVLQLRNFEMALLAWRNFIQLKPEFGLDKTIEI